jgi:hypothetical protein
MVHQPRDRCRNHQLTLANPITRSSVRAILDGNDHHATSLDHAGGGRRESLTIVLPAGAAIAPKIPSQREQQTAIRSIGAAGPRWSNHSHSR